MKKYYYFILAILILSTCIFIFKTLNYTHISAKFSELRPIHHKLKVYYKGIIIGKATEKKHAKDYNHTIIKITLYPKNLMLPMNSEVLLKKEKRKNKEYDFLEIIYPDNPSKEMIANGAMLKGIATTDIETYFKNQKNDDLNTIKENLIQSSQNLNESLKTLIIVLSTLNDILNQNQENIYNSTLNLSKTTNNINSTTNKFNRAIKQEKLDSTFDNLESSTSNLRKISNDLTNTTENLNSTFPQLENITNNINCITNGIKKTLKKPFGGIRLFFGKVITECEK